MIVFSDSYTCIGTIIPQQQILSTITIIEIVIGFLIVVVSIARLFGLLPTVNQIEK